MNNKLENKIYEELEQVDIDFSENNEDIENTNDNIEDDSVVEVSQVLVATNDASFEEVRKKNKKAVRIWIVSLFFISLVLLATSLFLVWIIKIQFLKPNLITDISKYIKTRNNNTLTVDDEKITYSPNSLVNSLKSVDLANMLLRSNEEDKVYRFTFYDKKTNKEVKKLTQEDILYYNNNIYLRVLIDAKSKNPFDLKEGKYKDLPFKIDLSKYLILYNEKNKIIFNYRKDDILLEVRKKMQKEGKTFEEAFYSFLNSKLNDVYLENGELNPIYKKLFFEDGRNKYLKDNEIEKLLIGNDIPNRLYLDNIFDYKFDTIFRFHDELNNRYYEYKANYDFELDFNILNYIRKKIALLKNNYFLKDITDYDFISNTGEKALANFDECYEVVSFLMDKNDPSSVYDYGKRVYHPMGKTASEKTLNKEYKVINIYPKIIRKKAYMLFKTQENELIDYKKIETGSIDKMPLDLSSIYFNKGNKYFNSKDQEFIGWRVLNSGEEITYSNIKKGIYYNFKSDVVLEPIIKNKVNLLVNLPHFDYKPRIISDKNYSLLNLKLSEDDNVYEALNKFRKDQLTNIPEFSSDNQFLGMYADPNYLSEIDKNVKAKDLVLNNVIYFKYKIIYYKVDFPSYFKKEYSQTIKESNLNIPIDELSDVVGNKILSGTYLNILHAKNLLTGLSRILNSYKIEEKDVLYNRFGGVINLSIKEEIKTNIKAILYNLNTSEFITESLAIRKYKKIPTLKDALRYDDPTRLPTSDGSEKLNYISYPYAVFNGVIYKISLISRSHNFTDIVNENDLLDVLNSINYAGEFYYSVFLKAEEIEKEYRYDVSYNGEKIFEKTGKSNLYGFDYKAHAIEKELAKSGLALQTPEAFFPDDYKKKAAEFLHNENFVIHYVAKKFYQSDLTYLNIKFKFSDTGVNREIVMALPFVFTDDFKDRNYFLPGKNLYQDYDGVKNIIKTVLYLYKKITIPNFDDFEINGFARYLENGEYKTLLFKDEPLSSYLDYTIRDGMFYEISFFEK